MITPGFNRCAATEFQYVKTNDDRLNIKLDGNPWNLDHLIWTIKYRKIEGVVSVTSGK